MPANDRLEAANVEAFVLAGGRSTRMGREKARLEWQRQPLAVHLAQRFAPHVSRLRLVAKRDSGLEDLGLEMLYDAEPDGALVHGIRAALEAPGPEWRLLLACDMPRVRPQVLQELWATAASAANPDGQRACGAAARLAGGSEPEPLPSLWSNRVAARITAQWGLAARDWVRHAGLTIVDIPPDAAAQFANVNTPDEWEAARRFGSDREESR